MEGGIRSQCLMKMLQESDVVRVEDILPQPEPMVCFSHDFHDLRRHSNKTSVCVFPFA